MPKLSVSFVFLAGAMSYGAAFAADLPSRDAPPPPMPTAATAFSWTGPYVGGLAGYSWADPTGSFSISSATLAAAPPIIPVIDSVGSQALGLRGGLFGAEAGYNWQASSLMVLGVEGDIEWGRLSGSHIVGGLVPNLGIPYTIAQSLDVNWQASWRIRAGFTPVERLLVYATGGPAVADLSYSSAFRDPIPESESVSLHATRLGFVIGGGIEYAFAARWSLKAEYLYSQFSPVTGSGAGVLTDGTTAYVAHSTGILRENTARLGLNYHFD
jgi:outer membrane immunogenic protein